MKSSTTGSVKSAIFALSMTSVNRFFRTAVSFILLAAVLLFSSVSAFADVRLDPAFQVGSFAVSPVGGLGTAFVTRAALGALGVEIAGSLLQLTPEDVTRAMWYGGGSTLPPSFTYPLNLAEYLSRQVIRIRPDSVTIGGVEYSDIWLPHDAADKFRTNAFDFITRYNLISESSGTFVSGAGFLDGIPYYQDGNTWKSSVYLVPGVGDYTVGNVRAHFGLFQQQYMRGYAYLSNNTTAGSNQDLFSPYGFDVYTTSSYGGRPTNFVFRFYTNSAGIGASSSYVLDSLIDAQPFDFTWTSQYIPADPLPSNYGFRTRLPSTYVKDLPQILDPESETYNSDLASLISGLETSSSEGTLTDPAFEEWDTPVPPASNTIANEPYSSLSGALSGISSLLGSISTSISQAAEAVISGDTGFFGNIVAALAAPFEPVFAIFRSGVGIWRYVVSWVGTISAPFTWSLSSLGGAGSYFLSPIYAAAAAAVVLAVYKKFGR